MTKASMAEFAALQGQEFRVRDSGVVLLLEAVTSLPHSAREGGGFRLEFLGPTDPTLPQGTYTMERDGEFIELFFVPIGRDEQATTYEAIFN